MYARIYFSLFTLPCHVCYASFNFLFHIFRHSVSVFSHMPLERVSAFQLYIYRSAANYFWAELTGIRATGGFSFFHMCWSVTKRNKSLIMSRIIAIIFVDSLLELSHSSRFVCWKSDYFVLIWLQFRFAHISRSNLFLLSDIETLASSCTILYIARFISLFVDVYM